MQASSTHPLLILNEMDSAYRKMISDSNAQSNAKNQAHKQDEVWSGVGFRITNDELVIKSNFINEIIDSNFQQNLSAVPGAKPWLLGLISLRGQPLSVIDLKQYLFGEPSVRTQNSRLVVIKNNDHVSGLFLEHVYGLRQFPNNQETSESSNKEKLSKLFSKNIRPLIDEVFNDNGINRGSLSIPALINNKDFSNAAR